MIALESLYLSDDKELSYKLALRAAFVLTSSKKEREKVFTWLKQAYGARGKVAHGKKPKDNLREIVTFSEEYLRQSIKRFLSISQTYSLKYLQTKGLDQNIIESGKLLRPRKT